MFCPKCGVEAGGARFCRTCGTNLTTVSNILDEGEHPTRRLVSFGSKTSVNVFNSSNISNNVDLNGHTSITVCGATKIDLTTVPLGPGETHIKVISVFGDVQILVPDDVEVRVKGLSIFGAIKRAGRELTGGMGTVNHKPHDFERANRRLLIDVTSVFAEVKIGL